MGAIGSSPLAQGQVESQVGTVRQRFFSPRLRVKSYEELNALLIDKCIAWAKANQHPEMTDRTVWEVFEAERPQLVPYAGRFDGFHSVPAHSTIVLEPMANKVSYVQDLPRAVRQQQVFGDGQCCGAPGRDPRLC